MKIYGHRGAAGLVAENTLESVAEALKYGVDGIEIDVHQCKSGEVIVIHDETLERTTNGTGDISSYTLQELQQYRTKEGLMIPTLAQVLDLIDARCDLNVELKGRFTAAPVVKLLEEYVVQSSWRLNQFVLSSFDHSQLYEAKKLNSEFRLGVLIEEDCARAIKVADQLGAYSVHPSIFSLTENQVKLAKKSGYKVYVWTVNAPSLIEKSKTWLVDGIITDFPNFA